MRIVEHSQVHISFAFWQVLRKKGQYLGASQLSIAQRLNAAALSSVTIYLAETAATKGGAGAVFSAACILPRKQINLNSQNVKLFVKPLVPGKIYTSDVTPAGLNSNVTTQLEIKRRPRLGQEVDVIWSRPLVCSGVGSACSDTLVSGAGDVSDDVTGVWHARGSCTSACNHSI